MKIECDAGALGPTMVQRANKLWSVYHAFRTTVAESPDKPQMEPTCGGPCDEPTLASPYDLRFLFNVGFTFGG